MSANHRQLKEQSPEDLEEQNMSNTSNFVVDDDEDALLSKSSSPRESLEDLDPLAINPFEDPSQSQANAMAPEVEKTVPDSTTSLNNETLLKKVCLNLFYILTWYIFSTGISLYNKWMVDKSHFNFPYPLFITSMHQVMQFICSGLCLLIFPSLRPTCHPSKKDYGTKIVPCGVATGLDIGLSNSSLKTITLSFYTMCKSSSLAFVLMFAFLFRLEKPTVKLIGIILIISIGVLLMVVSETSFVLVGFIQVMTAALLGGLRWSLTQILLKKESMGLHNPMATIFFLAPIMWGSLLICAIAIEGLGDMLHSPFFANFATACHTMLYILFGGLMAFLMVSAEFMLISRTSVVTLSVAGIFKEVVTIFVSIATFGDTVTWINIVGLCITLFGIGLYNWLKIHQMKRKNMETGYTKINQVSMGEDGVFMANVVNATAEWDEETLEMTRTRWNL
ncbi:TPT-domain-containing protein [Basidiobolus meristosporus CBS 931.73]|uniref:TPT-domain-containing protein n=1 Tax=Basidiobolus meristosporus CBS 931.73 TaxID=1314790 RepID=A0A1Y1XW99_9FUNG|nr:TPT-domain-containing protein [Basidiobolus meristosporus CBS 931.73]|eukprot:ORX90031.1 TPT-domain-containing protein [Basidiobolus meristosporus CBS 931.73]